MKRNGETEGIGMRTPMMTSSLEYEILNSLDKIDVIEQTKSAESTVTS